MDFLRVVAEHDFRIVGELSGEFAEVVGVLGAPLVGAEEQHAHALVPHLHEGFEEHLLSFPEGEASGEGDHGDVRREAVLLGFLLEGVFGGYGVRTEEIGIRPARDAHEARGVGVVCLEHVLAHVFGYADRAEALEHHAVVGNLEERGLRAVHAVERGDPRDAAHLRGPFDAPRRCARAHVHEGEALVLGEFSEAHRVAAHGEGGLAHEGKRMVRHAHRLERFDHVAALGGHGIGDAGLFERVRDFQRSAFHAAHLEAWQYLQDFHGGKYITIPAPLPTHRDTIYTASIK